MYRRLWIATLFFAFACALASPFPATMREAQCIIEKVPDLPQQLRDTITTPSAGHSRHCYWPKETLDDLKHMTRQIFSMMPQRHYVSFFDVDTQGVYKGTEDKYKDAFFEMLAEGIQNPSCTYQRLTVRHSWWTVELCLPLPPVGVVFSRKKDGFCKTSWIRLSFDEQGRVLSTYPIMPR